MLDIYINIEEVKKRLYNLKEEKSVGPDELSPRLLKKLADEIAEPLTMLFRKSLDEAQLQFDSENANITPLFKKGNKQKVDNIIDQSA